jgi:hypothetical protein
MLKLFASLLLLTTAALAQRTYDCGTLGQRACKWDDWEYYNMRWGSHKCEFDLEEQNDRCVDTGRRNSRPPVVGWLRWAMLEQSYGIYLDQPINRIPWFATHNSFSNKRQGFNNDFYTNHTLSITDQLNLGARHLELDPHNYAIVDDREVRACHSSTAANCLAPGFGTRLFGYVLEEIRQWLKAHPNEVIVLKMDDKNIDFYNADGDNELYYQINRYLSDYIYRPPTTFTRWPTMREIRAAGKRVVVMSHGNTVVAEGKSTVWSAKDYILTNNWPSTQNLTACLASDGTTAATRPANNWWDIAEGRTTASDEPFADKVGLMAEADVRKAVRCGVNILGLDFLGALDDAPLGARSGADLRLGETIWSFEENDYGTNGPALLKSNGRWASTPDSTLRRYACAPKRPIGDANDIRNWEVTNAPGPWGSSLGNAACVAQFGTGYEFAFPRNGFQNQQLREKINSLGISEGTWIHYSTNPRQFEIDSSISEATISHDPGKPAPPAIPFTIYARPGTQIRAQSAAPWLRIAGLNGAVTMPNTWALNTNLSIDPNLTPGIYNVPVQLTSTLNLGGVELNATNTIDVTVIVRRPIQVSLTSQFPSFKYNMGIDLTLALNQSNPSPKGTYTVVQTSSARPWESPATFTVQGSSQNERLSVLPPGRYKFAATYSGDTYYLPSSSSEIEVTVQDRIEASPNPITLTPASGPLTLNISRAQTGLTATLPCGWLSASVQSLSQILLTPQSAQINSLAPGTYSCDITLSDSLSATQGTTIVPVSLKIQTTLSTTLPSVKLLANTDTVTREAFVTTPGNRTIPLTVVSSQPWLRYFVPNGSTPTNVVLSADPTGLPAGLHTAILTYSSELASNTATTTVTFEVVRPTFFTSVPDGRTFYIDGAPKVTPFSYLWAAGEIHQISTDTLQTDQSDSGIRYRFINWTSAASQTHNLTIPSGGGTVLSANFQPEYRLVTDVLPNNTGTVQIGAGIPNSSFFAPNSIVPVTAIPNQGKAFSNWSGNTLSGNQNPASLTMSQPRYVIANFSDIQPVNITINSNAQTTIQVNGVNYTIPGQVPMLPGSSYTLIAPATIDLSSNARLAFAQWLTPTTQASASINYTAPANPTTINLVYNPQHLVSVTVSPAGAGTISGGGWYTLNSPVALTATPNTGYAFASYSGTGIPANSTNPNLNIPALSGAIQAVANFTATGLPNLSLSTAGARTNGPGPNQRTVPVLLRNNGQGPALDATITGIVSINVLAGSGQVTSTLTTPLNLGNINPGGTANTDLIFDWPTTATRIQFTVRFTANQGTYSGQTTLNLIR